MIVQFVNSFKADIKRKCAAWAEELVTWSNPKVKRQKEGVLCRWVNDDHEQYIEKTRERRGAGTITGCGVRPRGFEFWLYHSIARDELGTFSKSQRLICEMG